MKLPTDGTDPEHVMNLMRIQYGATNYHWQNRGKRPVHPKLNSLDNLKVRLCAKFVFH